jgi:putative redox protein
MLASRLPQLHYKFDIMANTLVTATIGTVPYTVTLSDGAHQWLGDATAEHGGAYAGPTPHSILLSALGTCTAVTLTMYAGRKTWALEGVEVILGYANEAPGTTTISREIKVKGNLDAEQKERLLQIANACPIHKILTGEIKVESTLAA